MSVMPSHGRSLPNIGSLDLATGQFFDLVPILERDEPLPLPSLDFLPLYAECACSGGHVAKVFYSIFKRIGFDFHATNNKAFFGLMQALCYIAKKSLHSIKIYANIRHRSDLLRSPADDSAAAHKAAMMSKCGAVPGLGFGKAQAHLKGICHV